LKQEESNQNIQGGLRKMSIELCLESEEKLSVNPQELAEKEFNQKISLSDFYVWEHSRSRLHLGTRGDNGVIKAYTFFRAKNYAVEFNKLIEKVKKDLKDGEEYLTRGFVDLVEDIGGFYFRIIPSGGK